MSNINNYTAAYVYVNGALLTEETQLTIDRDSGAQPVMTVVKGFAGVSPGAAVCNFSVDNAVPAAGFELNPGSFMVSNQFVEITIFSADQTLTFKGVILKDNFTHATNTISKLSFSGIGSFADWS